ncbi:AfsR/SARP family transcriptional regulator [Actinosynnema mirum]|uniref:Transcriptional regulator, SARP family n=1 Tax=Actinosynnema mirum (strain ATCC 29888 / DSM 43827 / JCM 3225 / NBRC 14064 / NCIMB 13271 / NRRL B-12336 / IMRU 3971 / 101) TaxID=446462 RepID=C6WGN6_ACTMD|nr:BTAD domain-containing putative transcriptional regulator [Actinosynnema mirum]ACU34352.1 transcriptional regulator, SARP family [Actinosynnema mirum DSM 43827]
MGDRSRCGLEFGVLGPLRVVADGGPIAIGRRGVRALLAVLVLEANRVVPIDELVDRLWGDEPPATARTIVHGYVSRLRKVLDAADPAGSARILTTPPGYQLAVDPWRLDHHRARRLISSARGKPATSRAPLLRDALRLWRGPVLADVPNAPGSDLAELRLVALEERAAAELELGHHLEVVGELRQLVAEHPFRERLVAQAVLALYRSGRRADALDAYQRFHRRLVDELGIDPGPDLRALHERVLRDDPALLPARAPETPGVAPRPGVVVPAQLPAAASGFVGRDEELAWLDRLCDTRDRDATTTAVLDGPPGIGKSELAVAWGHRRAAQFPDGLLFAQLGGHADDERARVGPDEVLARFLLALGVPADAVPRGTADRVGLYRSVLAGRRVLVVLDDARDAEHVRLLLPPGSGSLALVTSRLRLGSLVVSAGARVLTLDVLAEDESARLVDEAVGKPLSEQEPDAVRDLARLCGNLPLALRIAAARLVSSPEWAVASLVDALADDSTRLRALDLADADAGGGVGVARALALSYRELPDELAEVFRAAGLVPGRRVTAQAVAALCRTDAGTAARRLAELADAHLLLERGRGDYALHDLVRLYARELLADVPPERTAAALGRLLDHYLAACDRARRLLRPATDGLDPGQSDHRAARPATSGQALLWFDKEWPNIVALARAGAERGLHRRVWQLVRLVHTRCAVRAVDDGWSELAAIGLASARAEGDPRGEVLVLHAAHSVALRTGPAPGPLADARRAHRIAEGLGEARYLVLALDQLASALLATGETGAAITRYREAVEAARRDGDVLGEAHVLNNLAQAEQAAGRRETAARHQFQAAELFHRTGDQRGHALAVGNLAELYAELDLLVEAEESARQAVQLAVGGTMRYEEAFGRQVLGAVLARRGERSAARAELVESLRLFERLGSPRAASVRIALDGLGGVF